MRYLCVRGISMTNRTYHHNTDFDAALRIYREVGWISEKAHETAVGHLLQSGRGLVTELHGAAECLAVAGTGTMQYLDTTLPMTAVTSVTTSRIARKQGFAGKLTAQLLADEASRGYCIAMLGIFEQGYYNKLGFGNGGYQLRCTFDPSMLQIPVKARIPVRLGADDWQAMHEGRLNRRRTHGTCTVTEPGITQADVHWSESGFGLGYLDGNGDVSHHFWCQSKGEHGPYRINWMAYQSKAQFLELMALIQSLGDQVSAIQLQEPPEVQLQDLIRQPIKMLNITKGSPYENRMTSLSYWQARILDLQGCLAVTTLDCASLRFNLILTDPIESFVPDGCAWKGIAGEYTITLGATSAAEPGICSDLPTMHASVNAFTRLWLGIRSATSLSWTDDLQAPESLLSSLDHALQLPSPMLDWDF
jgi:predicted acetyltransferase